MIRFTVIWQESVLNHLARLWLSARDREKVRVAADALEKELATDAHLKGTSVVGLIRRLIVLPLDVLILVLEPDRQVHVISIKIVPDVGSNGELLSHL